MRYKITHKTPSISKVTGLPYSIVGLQDEQGKNYKVYLVPENRNYKRWEGKTEKGFILTNLLTLKADLIDADSFPKLISKPEPVEKISFRVCDLQTNLFAGG